MIKKKMLIVITVAILSQLLVACGGAALSSADAAQREENLRRNIEIIHSWGDISSCPEAEEAASEASPGSGPTSDSWKDIIASGHDGTYLEKYRIGDTKGIDLGEEGVIEMELVAFDADELADGSGKAHMTWIAKDLLNTKHVMNTERTNKGDWPSSDMRRWLRESILPLFPQSVRSNIKEVKKYSYSHSNGGKISSTDTIWIPSGTEVSGNEVSFPNKGPSYIDAFPEIASRKKQQVGTSEPSCWWLRDADWGYDTGFDIVYYGGSTWFQLSACRESGVAIGFCL